MKRLHPFEIADEWVRRGELSKAVRTLRRALRAGIDPASCYYRIAELHRLRQRWREAIQAARQAVQNAPDQPLCRILLFDILIESGSIDDALQESLAWLQRDPNDLTALENLARAYLQKSDPVRALKVVERLIRLHPGSPDYRLQRAHLLYQLGDYPRSAQEYMQVLAMDPPQELRRIAQDSLEMLDRWQLQLIVALLMENSTFRIAFTRDRHQTVQRYGFQLSEEAQAVLEYLPTDSADLEISFDRHALPN